MLTFLRLENEKVNISFPFKRRKHRSTSRATVGKAPALEDGDVTVWDSQAILVYLARKHDRWHVVPDRSSWTGARHAMAVFRGEGNVGRAGDGAGHPEIQSSG